MEKYNKTIALCALSLLFIASCAPSNSLTVPTVDASAIEISKSEAKIIFDACEEAFFNRETLANQFRIGKNAKIEHEYYSYSESIDSYSMAQTLDERETISYFEFSFDDRYLKQIETYHCNVQYLDENGNEKEQIDETISTNLSIYQVGEDINYRCKKENSNFPSLNSDVKETYPYKSNFQKFHDQYFEPFYTNDSLYNGILLFFGFPSYFAMANNQYTELSEKYYSKGEGSLIVEASYKVEKSTTTLYYEFSNYLCTSFFTSGVINYEFEEFSYSESVKIEYDNVIPKL